MKANLEIKFDFDRSITTETRFSLRNWLESFLRDLNNGNWSSVDQCFTKQFQASGIDQSNWLDKDSLIDRWKNLLILSETEFRFPELRIVSKGLIYDLKGAYEEYINSLLIIQGTIELTAIRDDNHYKFRTMQFYPRLIVHNDDSIL